MKTPRFALAALALSVAAASVYGQTSTPDVGSGSPTPSIQQQFLQAFYRNGFVYTVSLPPLADVKRLGTNGLVQEFQDTAKTSGVKLALIMPNQNTAPVEGVTTVFQMQATMYAYFSSIGVNTAGMPTMDTANCPSLVTANSCVYQLFDKPYALFVYKNNVNNVANTFFTRTPYYTKWAAAGGISAMGPAVSAETAVTSSVSAAAATAQFYDRGAVYNVTSGTNSGRIFAIKAPVYTLYNSNNREAGFLGFPIADEITLPNGLQRQTFEGGSIDYDPKDPSGFPAIRYPVSAIIVASAANTIRLNLGETAQLQANVFGPNGISLPDRQVVWTTTNGRVVTVGTGNPVTVKAVGGGTALVAATSEGKTSSYITFVVTAPCCQIGEGAPTASVSQAFQDAVTRNRLNIKLPAANAVVRLGAGYVQQLQGADGSNYLIAVSDRVLTGFVVSGKLLSRYLELGGPTGALGYPVADDTPGGRQNFEGGSLAGDPVQTVSGDILAKWAALGYETGVAGNPVGSIGLGLTFRATETRSQRFQNAQLITAVRAVKTYAVTGAILAKYASLGGPTGRLGAPLDDEYGLNGARRQDFEGGRIDYTPGAPEAQATESVRQPVVAATPSTVIAGTRLKLSIGGFDENISVRVSITGQPDFVVNSGSGAYVWDAYVPSTAKSGIVTVRAVDPAKTSNAAQTTYTIVAASDARLQITAIRGDGQTGVPGAVLPVPLTVVVRDAAGNTLPGIPVKFTASPGASMESAAASTDANGLASAIVRLPAVESVALITAEAGKQTLTMSAKAVRFALPNFPKFSQAVDGLVGDGPETIAKNGAMLASAAAILRYLQARGDASAPNGQADVAALNAWLTNACALDPQGVRICDGYLRLGPNNQPVVNLWRAARFAGNGIDVAPGAGDTNRIRDMLALGSPVLVALELRSPAGTTSGHFVVATGAGPDGSITIMDPDPAYNRATLDEYLAGFNGASGLVKATIAGIASFIPGPTRTGGFLVAADATASAASAAGPCGSNFELALSSGHAQLRYCDGSAPLYEIDLYGPAFNGSLTDMGSQIARYDLQGGGATAFKAVKDGPRWTVAPMDIAIAPGAIVNAASFSPSIAPGGLATVFGAGFGARPGDLAVEVNGQPATVLSVSPFQLNVRIPLETPLGAAQLHISSAAGTVDQQFTITDVAPALFTLAGAQAAAVNGDGTINSPTNPARRGDVLVLYGTGFGALVPQGAVMRTQVPVTATIGGAQVPVLFAGAAPGYPGLYQINLQLPAAMPPGLSLSVSIQQSNSASNTVQVAVQ